MRRARNAIAPSIVREKEEGLLFDDRATDRETEFILMFRRPHHREKPTRVEHGIAKILEAGAVELVLAGLNRIVLRALSLELNTGAAGFNLKLIHRFD